MSSRLLATMELLLLIAFAMLTAAVLLGCRTSVEIDPSKLSRSQPASASPAPQATPSAAPRTASPASPAPSDARSVAMFASRNAYPRGLVATKDLPLHVTISPDGNTLKVYNDSDQPLRDVKVWLNEAYVNPVSSISPGSGVILKRDQFFNRYGVSMGNDKSAIVTVEVQTDADHLYDAGRPVGES